MGYLVPGRVKTTDSGGFSQPYKFVSSLFTYPGGPLVKGQYTATLLRTATQELQTDLETNYATLRDSAGLLTGQQQALVQYGAQPTYGPEPTSNWLIWGLLVGLVALYFVFSK